MAEKRLSLWPETNERSEGKKGDTKTKKTRCGNGKERKKEEKERGKGPEKKESAPGTVPPHHHTIAPRYKTAGGHHTSSTQEQAAGETAPRLLPPIGANGRVSGFTAAS